jgi:hypothetical protein
LRIIGAAFRFGSTASSSRPRATTNFGFQTPRLSFLEELEGLEDDRGGLISELIPGKILPTHPAGVKHVGSGRELTSFPAAHIVHDHIMVPDPPAIRSASHDAIEYREHGEGFNVEAGFFLELAAHARLQRLAQLQHSARQGPLALQRLSPAANEQHPLAMNDYATYTYQGMIRELAFHFETGAWKTKIATRNFLLVYRTILQLLNHSITYWFAALAIIS